MEVIRGLHNLRPRHRGCVLTIGNYDGVHRGHRALIAELQAHARWLRLPAMGMVFEPTPREFLDPAGAPARLSSLREKLEDLRDCGLDRVLCVAFNARFAGLSAADYLDDLLAARLGVQVVAVGDDFRFGAARQGDFAFLRERGMRHGMEVVRLAPFEIDGERVSSTAVRARLAAGDLAGAELLLGRPYRMSGRALRGQGLGAQLDMPTANLTVQRKPAPRFGVYAVTVLGVGSAPRTGVANLGLRPTVNSTGCWLEVHIFDFSGALYGQRLTVQFRRFLRQEERFADLAALRVQMQRDAEAARQYFETTCHSGQGMAGIQ